LDKVFATQSFMPFQCWLGVVTVNGTTSTAICVNNALQREGITSLLQNTSYEVVATVDTPSKLTDQNFVKGGWALAIIVLDPEDGNLNAIAESIRRLKSLTPHCKVVMLAEASKPFDLPSLLALAPDGYILNPGSRDVLLRSLGMICTSNQQIFVLGKPPSDGFDQIRFDNRPVVGHQCWSTSGPAKNIRRAGLSRRESQVLICLARGESNKQIARSCQMSLATVKVHLRAVLRKTDAKNRTQAAVWAIERWLLNLTVDNPVAFGSEADLNRRQDRPHRLR